MLTAEQQVLSASALLAAHFAATKTSPCVGVLRVAFLDVTEAIIDNRRLKVGGLGAEREDGKTTTKKFSDANSAVLSVSSQYAVFSNTV